MCRLDNIQKLRRNTILLIKPLYSTIDIGLIVCLYFGEEGLDGYGVFSSLLDEDGIGECKHPLVEG